MRCFWLSVFVALVLIKSTQSQPSNGDIRLVDFFGNTGRSGGRVELYYNGEWGTVCDDRFMEDEADVVCRQVGFSFALNYGNNLGFQGGASSQQIWLDDVNCQAGSTNVLRECIYRTPIGSHNCGHSEDVMVQCSGTLMDGELRLAQGSVTSNSFEAGRLEILINGEWGTICDDGFGPTEADLACRQLGYSSALQYGNDLGFGLGSYEIWLDEVNCDASDPSILNCSHSGINITDCLHFEDVMINCGTAFLPTIEPASAEFGTAYGDLRLVQGSETSPSFEAGRLEIFINGEWGTICDDFNFQQTEADIACRQLGYNSAMQFSSLLTFESGPSSQPIWLEDVDCDPFDTRIIDCNHRGIGVHSCDHSNDIKINCGGTFIRISDPMPTGNPSVPRSISIIIGCVVAGFALIGLVAVSIVIGLVISGVFPGGSPLRSRRTATAPVVTSFNADSETVTTTATTTTQQTNTATDTATSLSSAPQTQAPSQEPPPAYDTGEQRPQDQEQLVLAQTSNTTGQEEA